MCTSCFEKKKIDPKSLDSQDHDPYSPGKFVPYHPFTKRYATSRGLLSDEHESSSWSPTSGEDEEAPAGKKATTKQKKKGAVTKKKGAVTKKKGAVTNKTGATPGNHTR